MKNYKKTTLWTSLLMLLLSSCQEANLPLIDAAKIEVYTEWKDYGFHFSAEVKKSENVIIKEQGFVFTYPRFDQYDSWSDYDKLKETFTVSDKTSFEYLLKKNCPPGLPCKVFAYVKTNYGNFRSDEMEVLAGNQETPVITSVLHVISESKDWWENGGTVYIEGTGFSDMARRNYLWVTDDTEEGRNMILEVVKSSATQLEATYRTGDWQKIGKFPLHLRVGKVDCMSKAYFEMTGTTIVSVEPSTFRYGDEVTLHLDNFQAKDDYQIKLLNDIDYFAQFKVMSVADNIIKLRMYPRTESSFPIRFFDKNDKYGKDVPTTFINPWKNNTPVEGVNLNSYCLYRDKEYYLGNGVLKCYDTASKQWSNYPFECPDVDKLDMLSMVGHGDYLYMQIIVGPFYIPGSDTSWATTKYSLYFYRFNLQTHRFERLSDINDIDFEYYQMKFAVQDEYTLFVQTNTKSYLYHIDTDKWEKASISFPDYTEVIGSWKGYIYYSNNWRIFRFKLGEESKKEIVFDGNPLFLCETRLGCSIIHDDYIYFKSDGGIYRIKLSESLPKLEILGGCEAFQYALIIIPTSSGIYIDNGNNRFKYSE